MKPCTPVAFSLPLTELAAGCVTSSWRHQLLHVTPFKPAQTTKHLIFVIIFFPAVFFKNDQNITLYQRSVSLRWYQWPPTRTIDTFLNTTPSTLHFSIIREGANKKMFVFLGGGGTPSNFLFYHPFREAAKKVLFLVARPLRPLPGGGG